MRIRNNHQSQNLQKNQNLNNYNTLVLFASFSALLSVIFSCFKIVYLSGLKDCAIVSALANTFGFRPISFAVVGAPTFFIDEEMFFGNDRFEFIKKALS